ncbi:MAG: hypothetical protein DMG49_12805 [Acidobacteria bacterium]|nr:MAG: hypothetical protein DMG49_12805 [Acidobacteriota bacterium]
MRHFCIAHFAGKEPQMDRKKGQRYSKEFRQQSVERMNACDNISRLSRELGVARHLLYNWRDRVEHAHLLSERPREFILRRQILSLKRVLANKTMEVDFFRGALQRIWLDVDRDVSLAARYLRRNKIEDIVARQFECRANVPIGPGESVGILSLPGEWMAC